MKYFEFSTSVINRVVDELEKAEEFIQIAVFQLHNKEVFDCLNTKLQNGVRVEILTLPYDSVNREIQEEVIERFRELEGNGATLYFCRWNIGDPERTTTAVGRWYSFHGKFIVTDKSAVALSANFTQQNELDALLIFEGEPERITEFRNKFAELLELFVMEHSGHSGSIRERIMQTNLPNVSSLFELPRVILTQIHKDHWIQDYPSSICPENVSIEDKLYVAPFDAKGGHLIKDIISEALEFVYISTESFTDPDISDFLIKSRLRDLDIRILTGATSMDYSDRIQRMLRELLANNIKLRTIEEHLHAKLIITDKQVVVSSINLNKMNLGFRRAKQLWRENTESIAICGDPNILSTAKSQYLTAFAASVDIFLVLAEKLENQIGKMFTSLFGLKSKREVKSLFARMILQHEIKVKQLVLNIGKITAKLMHFFDRNTVHKNDFLMALILYYLSERKHDRDQIEERLNVLNTEIDLDRMLNILQENNFVERDGDFYKIRLESLF